MINEEGETPFTHENHERREMKTTLTFEIGGRVEMRDLREGIALFTDLVFGLTPNRGVSWVVEDLRAGGAKVALRGESDDPAVLERIVAEYEKIGLELSQNLNPRHVNLVANGAALDILALAGRVDCVKFGTPRQSHTILGGDVKIAARSEHSISLGGITGMAHTLSDRDGLKLILRYHLKDIPVECHFAPEYADIAREAWGKRVTVYGEVWRNKKTGLPLLIRDARKVDILPVVAPGSYKKARGAIPWKSGDMRAEEAIRKIRDA